MYCVPNWTIRFRGCIMTSRLFLFTFNRQGWNDSVRRSTSPLCLRRLTYSPTWARERQRVTLPRASLSTSISCFDMKPWSWLDFGTHVLFTVKKIEKKKSILWHCSSCAIFKTKQKRIEIDRIASSGHIGGHVQRFLENKRRRRRRGRKKQTNRLEYHNHVVYIFIYRRNLRHKCDLI